MTQAHCSSWHPVRKAMDGEERLEIDIATAELFLEEMKYFKEPVGKMFDAQ